MRRDWKEIAHLTQENEAEWDLSAVYEYITEQKQAKWREKR